MTVSFDSVEPQNIGGSSTWEFWLSTIDVSIFVEYDTVCLFLGSLTFNSWPLRCLELSDAASYPIIETYFHVPNSMNVKYRVIVRAKDYHTLLFARFEVSTSVDVEDQVQVQGLCEWFATWYTFTVSC